MHKHIRIGTDCSGADAPIWALRAMNASFSHEFSCERDRVIRGFIELNSNPRVLFEDMLARDRSSIPDVDVYVCGFPCTPYSSLRGRNTRLFRETAARPYKETLNVLRDRRPPMAILENVIGLNRVMNKVIKDLERLGVYRIFVIPLDPAELGEPVARPRYYFLLMRVDSTFPGADLAAFVRDALARIRSPAVDSIESLMLPADHGLVKDAFCGGRSGDRVIRGLTCPRELRVYKECLAKVPRGLVVDVSQSADRVHPRSNGHCGTVLPRSKICVQSAGRVILPIEKLMLHLFPIHKMRLPPGISATVVNLLGGNTMHLKAVGVVLAIGLCLLQSPSGSGDRATPRPSRDSSMPRAVFLGARAAAARVSRDVVAGAPKRRRLS